MVTKIQGGHGGAKIKGTLVMVSGTGRLEGEVLVSVQYRVCINKLLCFKIARGEVLECSRCKINIMRR